MIDIVIVNWNTGDLLYRCVRSLANVRHEGVSSIQIVDNASDDGSEVIEDLPPTANVWKLERNAGFAAGCNVGAAKGSAPYILFLNPDTEVEAGTLSSVLAYMDDPANSDVGACGIRVVDDAGVTQGHTTDLPSAWSILHHSLRRSRFDHLSDRDVGHVIGAFYFVRRAVFEEVCGFDERFFMYFDDVDLSTAIHIRGWRLRYLSGPCVRHRGQGSSDRVPARRIAYVNRSRILYAFKYFTFAEAAFVGLFTLLIEPLLRLLRAICRLSRFEMYVAVGSTLILLGYLPGIAIDVVRLQRIRRDDRAIAERRGWP